MKTFYLFLLSLAVVQAVPHLQISSGELQPESEIAVVFQKAMVSKEKVGTEATGMVTVSPPWRGQWVWGTPHRLRFEPEQPPVVTETYQFSLPEGLQALDGTAVPVPAWEPVSTESFRQLRHRLTGRGRHDGFLIGFNGDVKPAAAASYFHFKAGELVVAAEVKQARWGDLASKWQYRKSWQERFEERLKIRSDRKKFDDEVLPHYLKIVPVSPLPIADGWKLVRLAGFQGLAAAELPFGNIRPLKLTEMKAEVEVNEPRKILIQFNIPIAKEQDMESLISVEPPPKGMKVSLTAWKRAIQIEGDFSSQAKWKVNVSGNLHTEDGLTLGSDHTEQVRFRHLPSRVWLPSHDELQLAHGDRKYEVHSMNTQSVHLRVKRLTGEQLVRVAQGYRHYTGNGPDYDRIKKRHALPFELINGTTVLDQELKPDVPFDTTDIHPLNWERLLPEGQKTSAFFVSARGLPTSHDDLKRDQGSVAQSLVQLTDIGLAWKLRNTEAVLYAYSCHTGLPLEGVTMRVYGEDAKPLSKDVTDAAGLVTLPRSEKQRHVLATLGADQFVIPFDQSLRTVGLWQFPVRLHSEPPLHKKLDALLFSDRTLYRPGETVHVKGIVRERIAGILQEKKGHQIVVKINGPDWREVFRQELTTSQNGSFDLTYQLPPERVGSYYVNIQDENDHTAGQHQIKVQEFKRQSFEVEAILQELAVGATSAAGKVTASYYQGTPVAKGKVEWSLSIDAAGFYPKRYRDFLFTDHRKWDSRYWEHYFDYRDNSGFGDDLIPPINGVASEASSESGEGRLDDKGKMAHEWSLSSPAFPQPRGLLLHAVVHDSGGEVLTGRAGETVHSSDFYLGLSRQDQLLKVGDDVPFQVVAVTKDGAAVSQPVEVTFTVTRDIQEPVKTRGSDGKVALTNQRRTEVVEMRQVTIPGNSSGFALPFIPKANGRHFFELTAKDTSGRAVRTVVGKDVYGAETFTWAQESGLRIKLVPEQKRYQPGETARVLVLSPIEGHALITVEREGVMQTLAQKLTLADPVIEIPLVDEHAPNVFVSVLVVKGQGASRRKHPVPELRLGYCELRVTPVKDTLAVLVEGPSESIRPGSETEVTVTVSDHAGRPVPRAEVTLYAVDDGTLAVDGYRNPDPMAHFHHPRHLAISTGTSLGNFVAEDPNERFRANKGFTIGGGDFFSLSAAGGMPQVQARTNFNPLATWAPILLTGSDGQVTHRFVVPDLLTRFRVIAVAHEGVTRFGTGLDEFIVDKPFMLEPAPPWFAHQGDHLRPVVRVQNKSSQAGTWEVTLELDSLTGSGAPGSADQKEQLSQTISLVPGAQGSLTFDLHLKETGTAKWIWSAKPLDALNAELADRVESTFEVRYPRPLLRARVATVLTPEENDLIKRLPADLLDGEGTVELIFARSRLSEAGAAIDYLLQYPYGCAEQTTSSTLPWLAVRDLRQLVPGFAKYDEDQIQESIQKRADRLLTMQTGNGGLAYWPGGERPNFWASSYGGMGLVLCREAGAVLPESTFTLLAKYLSEALRDEEESVRDKARALCTLRLLGKPEEAYENQLLSRKEGLDLESLAYLALATGRLELLERAGSKSEQEEWMRHRPTEALRLLALVRHEAPQARCDQELDRLLATRSRRGHWRTTFCNAWSFLALAEYAKRFETATGELQFTLVHNGQSRPVAVPVGQASTSVMLATQADLSLVAQAETNGFVDVRVAVKPRLEPVRPVSQKGFEVLRRYERVLADGSAEPVKELKVGDLISVNLQVMLPPGEHHYLVVDDPLPACVEAINHQIHPDSLKRPVGLPHEISKVEYRSDRVALFMDYVQGGRGIDMSYQVRVTQAGRVEVPPTKLEPMYEPENFSLSASEILISQR